MSTEAALDWLKSHQLDCGALPVSSADSHPYPEVTGYCLPTLCRFGEANMADRAAEWLLQVQGSDGAWCGPDGETAYWFDTAVIAGSLLATADLNAHREPEIRAAVGRAVGWLARDLSSTYPPVQTPHHHPEVPAEINLLGLARLRRLPQFEEALQRWLGEPGALLCTGKMQHFYAYTVEAVAEVDERYAWQLCGRFARAQALDGSLAAFFEDTSGGRAVPVVRWRCYPAIAQWAAIWARLGYRAAAERSLEFLAERQTASGGLVGSNGPYFPKEELTWAVKYYLDARWAIERLASPHHREAMV